MPHLGIARLALNKPTEAMSVLDKAAKADASGVTLMLAGRAHALSGDVAGARPLYERAFAAEKDSGRTEAGVTVQVQMRGWAGEIRHASARAFVQTTLRQRWVARADARMAWYDDSPDQGAASYWDGYLEAGYAWDGISLNLGFGFDPVVFDPVVGDYADIGRTEYLRGAIDKGVRRSDASPLLQGMRGLEQPALGQGQGQRSAHAPAPRPSRPAT